MVSAVLTPIIIDDVHPRTPSGCAAKGGAGETLPVSAVLIADGHDLLGARVRWKPSRSPTWRSAPLAEAGGGRWSGEITPDEVGMHDLVVEAWTARSARRRHAGEVKVGVGPDRHPTVGTGGGSPPH